MPAYSLSDINTWFCHKYPNTDLGKINANADKLNLKKISTIASLDEADENCLSFALNNVNKAKVQNSRAFALITHPCWSDLLEHKQTPAIICSDTYLKFAKISYLFFQQPNAVSPTTNFPAKDSRHLSQIDSEIKADVKIGAYSVIEKNVKVGENSQIGPQCWIGENVQIGKNCLIYANVKIYQNAIIGDNVIIHSGVVIGADGFGFTPQFINQERNWFKIPQTAKVVIGDNVEIGANSTIDRGALSNTIIANGVKIDNLIQIAHGVKIGENTLLMASCAIAGSTSIGKNCLIGGQSGIAPSLTIVDNVIIHPQAQVLRDINVAGEYSGAWPLQKHWQWLRTQAKFLKFFSSLHKQDPNE